jgi:hypothetical protein
MQHINRGSRSIVNIIIHHVNYLIMINYINSKFFITKAWIGNWWNDSSIAQLYFLYQKIQKPFCFEIFKPLIHAL